MDVPVSPKADNFKLQVETAFQDDRPRIRVESNRTFLTSSGELTVFLARLSIYSSSTRGPSLDAYWPGATRTVKESSVHGTACKASVADKLDVHLQPNTS